MSAPVRLRGSTYVLLAGLACLAASVQAADPPNESGEVEEAHSDPIIVLGDRRNDASSVLRSGLGPLDVSRAVQVFSRTLLDEVRPETIDDALTLISNVAYQGDTDGRENAFLIRGFQSATVLRDGFRVETFGGVADPELYNLESLEVIKGPSSVLFGESNPGGLVNMRAKRPLARDHAEFAVESGTDGMFSPRFDLGGRLGSERIRFRLVALYRYDDGWRGYDNPNERMFLAPSLHWAITDNTALTLIGEATQDDFQADFGTAVDLDGKLTARIQQVNNHPQDRIDRHQYTIGADLVQRFSDEWYLTARGRHFDGGYEFSALWLPISLDLASFTYVQLALQQEQQNKEDAFQLSITGDTKVVGRNVDLVIGADYRVSTTERSSRLDAGSINVLNWADPDYSRRPPPKALLPLFPALFAAEEIERIGVYASTHVELTEGLKLNLGGRYDSIDRMPLPASPTAPQEVSDFTFQAGAIYSVTDSLSAYAAYSESFAPNSVFDKNNNLLEPERGEGFDVGLKGSGVSGMLSFTLSLFDITKTNVALPDPTTEISDPNPFGFIASAKQTSRGADVDFDLALADNWKIHGGFGYADTEDQGTNIVGAPEFTASLRTSYRFEEGTLEGLTIGGGVRHVGSRLALADPNGDGDSADKVEVDSYTLLDLFVRYEYGERWQLQANLSNVTDERYVLSALNDLDRLVHAGAPFEALFSLTYRYD
tara:strand:+ start:413105 stop:415246 length:2142 start_codon:yes stop_codon:yes gene_type:complete